MTRRQLHTINFEVDTLYGWEFAKDIDRVKRMMDALREGTKLPRVNVFRQHGEYYLDDTVIRPNNASFCDGGHHRAIAHYILGAPFEVWLTPYEAAESRYYPVPIQNVRLVSANELDRVEDELLTAAMEATGD